MAAGAGFDYIIREVDEELRQVYNNLSSGNIRYSQASSLKAQCWPFLARDRLMVSRSWVKATRLVTLLVLLASERECSMLQLEDWVEATLYHYDELANMAPEWGWSVPSTSPD